MILIIIMSELYIAEDTNLANYVVASDDTDYLIWGSDSEDDIGNAFVETLPDYGQNSVDWIFFLNTLHPDVKIRYIKRVDSFFRFNMNTVNPKEESTNLLQYFIEGRYTYG
jgi:hypothetical protein